jgi:ubiquinone/menaquinone biosynthesis C-methylase UbiE
MSDAPFLNNMQLQSEHKLILSPTVANSRMNRARKASGVNSYEQDIFFKPEEYLQNIIAKDKSASWLDLCCGEGNALLQVYEYFSNTDQLDKIKLTGIDLIECDKFLPDQIKIYIGPVLDFNSSEKFDLITCIHGLHYVGDKLEAISKASTLLTTDGLFIANLDFNDFAIENTNTTAFLNAQLKKE